MIQREITDLRESPKRRRPTRSRNVGELKKITRMVERRTAVPVILARIPQDWSNSAIMFPSRAMIMSIGVDSGGQPGHAPPNN